MPPKRTSKNVAKKAALRIWAMQPNDLPIVCLPLDLSDQSAASLIEFLHQLIDALEWHYAAQELHVFVQSTAW